MKTLFIVNPCSGAGRAGKEWKRNEHIVRKHFSTTYEVSYTQYPEHATELAKKGLGDGFRRIISVGGDGTLNEVMNGFIWNDVPVDGDAALGMIEFGTGSDFNRTVRMPRQFESAIQFIKERPPSPTDIGRATFCTIDGKERTRYFINILDFGIGGAVVERVNRTTKKLGGSVSFLLSIFITLATFRNKTIEYRLDGNAWQKETLNNFIIANGRYFGSGLCPAPFAQLDDGLFDIILFGDIGTARAMLNLPSLRKGTHLSHPLVRSLKAREIAAHSDGDVFVDMDGEMVGRLPISVEIIPRAIPFIR